MVPTTATKHKGILLPYEIPCDKRYGSPATNQTRKRERNILEVSIISVVRAQSLQSYCTVHVCNGQMIGQTSGGNAGVDCPAGHFVFKKVMGPGALGHSI
jgi:hypothetical protein